jgi:hypothetical protein
MELTITQNGGLYALQHREVRRYRSNLQQLAEKPHASPLATLGHFPDAFPYNWWH